MQAPSDSSSSILLRDEAATSRLGAALARAITDNLAAIEAAGLFISLSGALGAGKTTLVRAMLRQLGVEGPIRSPTFSLLEPYVVSRLNFYHFDFFRFTASTEFAESGFRELFGAGGVCLVEWPEKASGALPTPDLLISFEIDEDRRRVTVSANGTLGEACRQTLNQAMTMPPP